MVNRQHFRSDLFYRLAVVEVAVPALRERLEDIPLLAEALVSQLGASEAGGRALLSPPFLSRLREHRWPGNVRELRNYLERCLALGEPPPLAVAGEHSGGNLRLPYFAARRGCLDAFERDYLQELLHRTKGNVSAAARQARLGRTQLYRLLRRHGLRGKSD
jgi:DNA-binding NtrC family response regulator